MARSNLASKELLASVGDLAVELYKSGQRDPQFAANRPGVLAAMLIREHTKYHQLLVKACNVPVDEEIIRGKERGILRRLRRVGFPLVSIKLGGDPRGCVMFLNLPSRPIVLGDPYSFRVPRELEPLYDVEDDEETEE